jgi:hypothetical protein
LTPRGGEPNAPARARRAARRASPPRGGGAARAPGGARPGQPARRHTDEAPHAHRDAQTRRTGARGEARAVPPAARASAAAGAATGGARAEPALLRRIPQKSPRSTRGGTTAARSGATGDARERGGDRPRQAAAAYNLAASRKNPAMLLRDFSHVERDICPARLRRFQQSS